MQDRDILESLTTSLPADERERLTVVLERAAAGQLAEARAAAPPRPRRWRRRIER